MQRDGARVLLVSADLRMLEAIRRELSSQSCRLVTIHDAETGLAQARHSACDLLLLDADIPGADAVEACRRLRLEGHTLPILLLSSREAVGDRVAGLDAGVDDYLVKPFAVEELHARMRALLRRANGMFDAETLRLGDLVLTIPTREVRRGGRRLNLTAREFDLLQLFLRHPRQVLTRTSLIEAVWGYDFGGESNVVDVYVRYLRAKLEVWGGPRLIQTVRGVGYALREE